MIIKNIIKWTGIVSIYTLLGILFYYFPVKLDTFGKSMAPTILDSDMVIAVRNTNIGRGDIVIINMGNRWLEKRIIGLPGEQITIIGQETFINERRIEENYVVFPNQKLRFFCNLGEDEYFVMGDNRPESNDSRFFGPVKRSQIIREVKMVIGCFK